MWLRVTQVREGQTCPGPVGTHKIVALEVELSSTVDDSDVRYLHWLRSHYWGMFEVRKHCETTRNDVLRKVFAGSVSRGGPVMQAPILT
jgi:hypothetical protein